MGECAGPFGAIDVRRGRLGDVSARSLAHGAGMRVERDARLFAGAGRWPVMQIRRTLWIGR